MKQIITFLLVVSSLFFTVSCERNSLYNYIKENTAEDEETDVSEVTPDTPDTPDTTETLKVFVSTTGSDSTGNGTQASPYLTIQHAIDNAPIPSLVCVATGIYNVTSPVLMKSGVSLLGGYNPGTWVRGGYQSESERAANSSIISYTGTETGTNFLDPVRTIEFSSSDIGSETYIEGFIINGKSSAAAPCAVFVYSGASPVIRYNTINGGVGTGTHAWAVIAAGGSNPSILNNRIDAPTGASSYTYSVYVYESFSTIKGNDLYTYSSATPNQCVIQAYYNSDVLIDSNNINLGNGSSSNTGIRIDTLDTAAVIKNNNISGSSPEYLGIYSSCSGTEITGNTINISGSGSSNDAIRLNGAVDAIIEQNTITDSGCTATGKYGIVIYSSSTSTIRGNVIILSSASQYASCIYDSSGTNGNKIFSNFINANGSFTSWGYGVNVMSGSTILVNNTILTNNTGGGNSTAVYVGTGTPVIINNIISGSGSGVNYGIYESTGSSSNPLYVQNNLFFNCNTAIYTDDSSTDISIIGNLTTSYLADSTTASGNIFQIINLAGTGVVDPGSWSIIDSAGLDISASYSGAMTDLAGAARVVPITIGAYEY